jgi:hypothetical protein
MGNLPEGVALANASPSADVLVQRRDEYVLENPVLGLLVEFLDTNFWYSPSVVDLADDVLDDVWCEVGELRIASFSIGVGLKCHGAVCSAGTKLASGVSQ